jgi:hypothetical protein
MVRGHRKNGDCADVVTDSGWHLLTASFFRFWTRRTSMIKVLHCVQKRNLCCGGAKEDAR